MAALENDNPYGYHQMNSGKCHLNERGSYSPSRVYDGAYNRQTDRLDLTAPDNLVTVARNLEQMLYNSEKLNCYSGASAPSSPTDLQEISAQLDSLFREPMTQSKKRTEDSPFKHLELDVELNLLVDTIIAE